MTGPMTAAAVESAAPTITAPVVRDDLPEAVYHASRDSLSYSGAKTLLTACPARYRWELDHGRPPKAAFDLGHAVHSLVLGVGEPIVVVDAPDWKTKAAQEKKKDAYAAGHVPLLEADYAAAEAAADAVRAHPTCAALLADGTPERSLFWRDETHDVGRRARPDWMTQRAGRTIVLDLKTCVSASLSAIAKSVANFRYFQQHPWYLDGVRACGLGDDPAFLFAFVEKEPPHLVTVVELDGEAVAHGAAENERALAIYAECVRTDTWPAYAAPDDIPAISLPAWALKETS